jgi:hypothetical protein
MEGCEMSAKDLYIEAVADKLELGDRYHATWPLGQTLRLA